MENLSLSKIAARAGVEAMLMRAELSRKWGGLPTAKRSTAKRSRNQNSEDRHAASARQRDEKEASQGKM